MLIPFFLVLFASFYLSLATTSAGFLRGWITRCRSGFTVTVFATVGFGDIVPLTTLARLVTSVQTPTWCARLDRSCSSLHARRIGSNRGPGHRPFPKP
jgi:hypothetical protein